MQTLEKTYLPFVITNIVIFSIAIIPIIGIVYSVFFLYIPAIGFSVCNFIIAKDGRYGTRHWDLTVLILSVVAALPAFIQNLTAASGSAKAGPVGGLVGSMTGGIIGGLLGWLASALALAFSITILVKFNKYKSYKSRINNDD